MKLLKTNLSMTSILPLINTETDFKFIRSYLMNRPTITEHQIASRIAKTIDPNSKETLNDSLLRTHLAKTSKWIDNLIIHCTHEQRLESYKTDIHQLWNQTFTGTPVINTKLIVGNRNSRNAAQTLAHRRPHHKSSPPTINHATDH